MESVSGLPKILASACLLGQRTRYDGQANSLYHSIWLYWQKLDCLQAVCPEILGGLPVPRPAAEILAPASGVLEEWQVVTQNRQDVSAAFLAGARRTLELCEQIQMAVLKEGSPSCGSHLVYDGTFQARKISGQGITCALLEKQGIRVFSESELFAAKAYWLSLQNL